MTRSVLVVDDAALTQATARQLLGLATVAPLTGTAGWTLRPGVGGATITAYLGFTLGLTGGGSADAVTVEWDNVSASVVGLR